MITLHRLAGGSAARSADGGYLTDSANPNSVTTIWSYKTSTL